MQLNYIIHSANFIMILYFYSNLDKLLDFYIIFDLLSRYHSNSKFIFLLDLYHFIDLSKAII